MFFIRIYLAGSVDETEYRKEVKEKYKDKFELIDPMDHISFDPVETVQRDIKEIIKCDILVAYIRKPTFGTSMEIKFSDDMSIPVFVIEPENKWRADPWLKYHTTSFFDSIEFCFNYIRDCWRKK